MQTRTTALAMAAAVVVALAVWLMPPAQHPPTPAEGEITAQPDDPPAVLPAEARIEVSEPKAAADVSPANRDGATTRVSIRLLDRKSRAPVTSKVELWQLDLPAVGDWTAGDRKLREYVIREPGAEFDLAPGRYRVAIACQPATSEDPAGFTVGTAPLDLAFPVDLPQTIEVWLQVFDEHGRPIESGRLGESFEMQTAALPRWADPRRNLTAPPPPHRGGGGSSMSSHPRNADPARGFPLGRWRQRLRSERRAPKRWVRTPDRGPVWVDLRAYAAARDAPEAVTRTYVGVAVPKTYFDGAVLVPDGRTARAAGADYSVSNRAQERTPGSYPDLWRWVPIRVIVSLKGYRDVQFEHRLIDGDPPVRVMEPK